MKEYIVIFIFSLNGSQILIEGVNLTFKGQLLKSRICSLGSKFFPERVDPSFEELCHPVKSILPLKTWHYSHTLQIFSVLIFTVTMVLKVKSVTMAIDNIC